MMPNVMACILAGGEGKRLRPLTAQRAKPAVRFAGSYRLIDFSLSNCINSHLWKILVFPQYQAPSLEHHLRKGWSFLSAPLGEYVRSLPPQLQVDPHGYRGTADALYQNLATLDRLDPRAVLILGGDHVYYLDYRDLLAFHQACQADVTVGTFPVPAQHAHHFGIVTVDPRGMVTAFVEKPTAVRVPSTGDAAVLASMGIYVFSFEVLRTVLLEDSHVSATHDFGLDILPGVLGRYRVAAFPFVQQMGAEPAYWRDVGTLDAYWEAHMDLLGPQPRFHLDHRHWPLHPTHTPQSATALLSPGEVRSDGDGRVMQSLMAQGCLLQGGRVVRSVLSPGSALRRGRRWRSRSSSMTCSSDGGPGYAGRSWTGARLCRLGLASGTTLRLMHSSSPYRPRGLPSWDTPGVPGMQTEKMLVSSPHARSHP